MGSVEPSYYGGSRAGKSAGEAPGQEKPEPPWGGPGWNRVAVGVARRRSSTLAGAPAIVTQVTAVGADVALVPAGVATVAASVDAVGMLIPPVVAGIPAIMVDVAPFGAGACHVAVLPVLALLGTVPGDVALVLIDVALVAVGVPRILPDVAAVLPRVLAVMMNVLTVLLGIGLRDGRGPGGQYQRQHP